MDTFEIKDDEIDVEDIMRQIKENIRRKRENGVYTKEMEALINEPLMPPGASIGRGDSESDLTFLNSNWDMQVEYNISSHRPIIGRLLIGARQMIHGEVKRYADLLAEKQTEFNIRVVRMLNNLDEIVSKKVSSRVNEVLAAADNDIKNKAWLANLLEERNKEDITRIAAEVKQDEVMNYFLFEEKHRGSIEEIKKRQSVYLEYFKKCPNVLDIGCGRGEFLTLLKENGIGARGIDINEDMVLYCQKNGLDVRKADALSYLRSLENKTLDGTFSSQVVEHLQPDALIALVKLCHEKMKYGTYFVAETINPLCLTTSALFNVDLSHVKPVHPETIKFILESVGFREIEFKFISPHPEDGKLSKIIITDNMSGDEKERNEVMNKNIDKLNSLLFGFQDYAVIAKK